jgi:protein-disulfide isomerase
MAAKSARSSKTAPREQSNQPTVALSRQNSVGGSATDTSPYSLAAMINFLSNNAGLIFIALSLFIVGFLAGSLWTENTLLKKGALGAGSGTAQVQPGTGTAGTGAVPPEAAPQVLSDADWAEVQAKPAGVIGNDNAKIKMVEFTDYQCPFCSRHFTETYPSLKKDYVDKGLVQIILRDQPLTFHPNARISALAARCANDQGKFEAMHDELFAKQDSWANLGKEDAIKKFGDFANSAGINGATLMDCVKTEKHGAAVDEDIALGTRVGASGTPTFFINKETLVGALPYATFKAALDKALQQ